MRYRSGPWAALGLAAAVLLGQAPPAAGQPPPTVVAFALDTSGSIGRPGLNRTRELALSILGALPPGSEVAVLTFDDQSRVVVPRTSRPEEVTEKLAGVDVAGRHTALHDALYDASRYLVDAPGQRKAIVLITDGVDENSALNLEDGLKVAQEAHIPVFAVAVGSKPRERVLRRIAKLTAGEYMTAEDASGADLAARIAALPATAAEAAPATMPRPAAGAAAPPAAGPAAIPPTRMPMGRRTRIVWAALALAVLAAAGALVVMRRLARSAPACPTCGRRLPEGSDTCPACAEDAEGVEDTAVPSTPPPRRGEPVQDLSATVMSRLSTTEEYLEQTAVMTARPVLAVTKGEGAGEVYELSQNSATSIGRSRANDIQIGDVSVSSQHCRVRPENGRFVLHDLQSTNGTLVNDKKVARHVLQEGDVITIGETALTYRRELKRG